MKNQCFSFEFGSCCMMGKRQYNGKFLQGPLRLPLLSFEGSWRADIAGAVGGQRWLTSQLSEETPKSVRPNWITKLLTLGSTALGQCFGWQ